MSFMMISSERCRAQRVPSGNRSGNENRLVLATKPVEKGEGLTAVHD
jgi:hypothetical protein